MRNIKLNDHRGSNPPCRQEIRLEIAVVLSSSCPAWCSFSACTTVVVPRSCQYCFCLSAVLVMAKYAILLKLLAMQLILWTLVSLKRMKHNELITVRSARFVYKVTSAVQKSFHCFHNPYQFVHSLSFWSILANLRKDCFRLDSADFKLQLLISFIYWNGPVIRQTVSIIRHILQIFQFLGSKLVFFFRRQEILISDFHTFA